MFLSSNFFLPKTSESGSIRWKRLREKSKWKEREGSICMSELGIPISKWKFCLAEEPPVDQSRLIFQETIIYPSTLLLLWGENAIILPLISLPYYWGKKAKELKTISKKHWPQSESSGAAWENKHLPDLSFLRKQSLLLEPGNSPSIAWRWSFGTLPKEPHGENQAVG